MTAILIFSSVDVVLLHKHMIGCASILHRGTDDASHTCSESMRQTFCVTFGFMVGELVVGQAEPSLLEVLQTEAVSPLSSFDHESGRSEENKTLVKV